MSPVDMSAVCCKVPVTFQVIEKRLDLTCDVLENISIHLNALKSRRSYAEKRHHRALAYTLQLQIVTLERVHAMYYEFASRKAKQLIELSTTTMRDTPNTMDFTAGMTR